MERTRAGYDEGMKEVWMVKEGVAEIRIMLDINNLYFAPDIVCAVNNGPTTDPNWMEVEVFGKTTNPVEVGDWYDDMSPILIKVRYSKTGEVDVVL